MGARVDERLVELSEDFGFVLVPLRDGSKAPAFKDYMDDPKSELVLGGKWSGNVGVLLNRSGLLVIDIDYKGGVNGLRSLYEFMLSQGWQLDDVDDILRMSDLVVSTAGGGYHLYFYRPDDFPIGRFISVLPGVDVLSNGLCVLPPSSIENKRTGERGTYAYVQFGEPTECDDDLSALFMLLTGLRDGKPISTRQYEPFLRGDVVGEGSRFSALQSLAGYIASRTGDADDLEHWLRYYDKNYCDPPLQSTEPSKFESLLLWAKGLVVEEPGKLYKPPTHVSKPVYVSTYKPKQYWLDNISDARKRAAEGDSFANAIVSAVDFFALDTDEPFLLRKTKDARLYRPQFAYYNNHKVIVGIEQAHVSPILKQWGLKVEDILPYTPEFVAMTTQFAPPHKQWKRFIITEEGILLNTAHRFNIYLTDEEIKDPPTDYPEVTISFLKHISSYNEQRLYMLLQWIRQLLFNPTQKLPALVLHSAHRATGKTLFQRLLAYIVGGAGVWVNNSVLESRFNASFASARLCLIEEALISKRKALESLKAYITNTTISVEGKFTEATTRDFYGVFCLSTNNIDFLPLAEEEDRFILLNVPKPHRNDPYLEQKLYDEARLFIHWLFHNIPHETPRGRLFFSPDEVKQTLSKEAILESLTNKQIEILETIRQALDCLTLGTEWIHNIPPTEVVIPRNGYFYININALISIIANMPHIKGIETKDIYDFFKNTTKTTKSRIRIGNKRSYVIALTPQHIKYFDLSPLTEKTLSLIANNPHLIQETQNIAQAIAPQTDMLTDEQTKSMAYEIEQTLLSITNITSQQTN